MANVCVSHGKFNIYYTSSGGTATFTAVYTIDQQAVDSGSVVNSVVGVASSPSGNSDTSDTSDDGDDSDGDIDDDPTIITLTATPSIDVSKSASC